MEYIKRHHGKIDSTGIEVDCFLSIESLLRHTKTYLSLSKKHGRQIVYLITFEGEDKNNAIIIDEDADVIINAIDSGIFAKDDITDVFLQEYISYESAYEVALMMKEVSPLCYDDANVEKN